jgi:ankyrin repeat protein
MALHLASRWGYNEIIKLLLKYRADVAKTDTKGKTALHIAIARINQVSTMTTGL